MILSRIDDDRDSLQKSTRFELADYAKANGLDYVSETMTKDEIIEILRSKNLTQIPIPDRLLGVSQGKEQWAPITYKNRILPPPPAETKVVYVDISKMAMPQLRKACKAQGIKMERTDNLQTLRQKLGQATD